MNVTIQPCALLSAVGSISCVNPRCTAESLLLFTASPRIVTSQAHLEFCFAPVDALLQRFALAAKLVSKLPVWLAASRKRSLLTPESLSGLANQRVISQAVNSNE